MKYEIERCVICKGFQPSDITFRLPGYVCDTCLWIIKCENRRAIENGEVWFACRTCGAYLTSGQLCFDCDLTPDEQYACRENEGEPHPI